MKTRIILLFLLSLLLVAGSVVGTATADPSDTLTYSHAEFLDAVDRVAGDTATMDREVANPDRPSAPHLTRAALYRVETKIAQLVEMQQPEEVINRLRAIRDGLRVANDGFNEME